MLRFGLKFKLNSKSVKLNQRRKNSLILKNSSNRRGKKQVLSALSSLKARLGGRKA